MSDSTEQPKDVGGLGRSLCSVCPKCGRTFQLSRRQVLKQSRGIAVYCRVQCAASSNARVRNAMPIVSRTCQHCDAVFLGTRLKRFCERCAAYRKTDSGIPHVCLHCGTQFGGRRKNMRHYCSRRCSATASNADRRGKKYTDDTYAENPLEHIGLVYAFALKFRARRPARYRDGPIDETDQFQDGALGLVLACKRFDASNGATFATFACRYIKGYIMRGMSDWRKADVADAYLTDDGRIAMKIA